MSRVFIVFKRSIIILFTESFKLREDPVCIDCYQNSNMNTLILAHTHALIHDINYVEAIKLHCA